MNDQVLMPLPIEPPIQAAVTVQDMTKQALATITPQQARVGEVSEALMGAYGRASTLELTEGEIEGLLAPFEDSQVEIRPHDGLIYIPHIHISNRLNRVFKPGRWSLVCRRHWLEGGTLYGEYVLLVKGCFVGESVGGHQYQPNNPKTNYSDSLESTAAEALRRICGKRLGCGSQVWEPEYSRRWVEQYAVQERGKWAKRPTANPSPPGVSEEGPAIKTPPGPTVTTARATPKPAPQVKVDPLAAFQERCKVKLIGKATADPVMLPYWQRFAVEKGWILPNEPISAILGNVTAVFTLDPEQDAAGNSDTVKLQFLAFEDAVKRLYATRGQELPNAAVGYIAGSFGGPEPLEPPPEPEPIEIAGHKDASAKGCPNCGHKSVILSKDFEGVLYCQTCAWQWDIQSGDYYEEHDWQKVVCPIPPKGMKKADYQPQTLGQIFRLDPKRAYGLCMNNSEEKALEGRTWQGRHYDSSREDIAFGKACDLARDHMESGKTSEPPDDPDNIDQPF